MIESWNQLAAELFGFARGAALASLVLLAVAAGVWALVRRRASAHLGAALFVLPLVPLVVPLPTLAVLDVPFAGEEHEFDMIVLDEHESIDDLIGLTFADELELAIVGGLVRRPAKIEDSPLGETSG